MPVDRSVSTTPLSTGWAFSIQPRLKGQKSKM
jgi:hypothetical protein